MKKKIIVVDDKQTIGVIIAAYLSADYDFEYFNNPLPCIERLKNGNLPDLIISDIMMPNMTGDKFLEYLKSDNTLSAIPVVMLSGEDSSSQRILLLESGAEDYIVKPFNPMELKIRISKVLK